MANTKKSDLYVVTKVKELTKYVITVTEKSPKKFRFTLVTRTNVLHCSSKQAFSLRPLCPAFELLVNNLDNGKCI